MTCWACSTSSGTGPEGARDALPSLLLLPMPWLWDMPGWPGLPAACVYVCVCVCISLFTWALASGLRKGTASLHLLRQVTASL
eukprot:scaffold153604_cov16-Tisochrysis_lutea.AAC.1